MTRDGIDGCLCLQDSCHANNTARSPPIPQEVGGFARRVHWQPAKPKRCGVESPQAHRRHGGTDPTLATTDTPDAFRPCRRREVIGSRTIGITMKLTFLGANRQVTGSRYSLEANRSRLMIDCGLVQSESSSIETGSDARSIRSRLTLSLSHTRILAERIALERFKHDKAGCGENRTQVDCTRCRGCVIRDSPVHCGESRRSQ